MNKIPNTTQDRLFASRTTATKSKAVLGLDTDDVKLNTILRFFDTVYQYGCILGN